MSKRLPSHVVNDILYCIGHIEDYTNKLSLEDFMSDFMVIEACLYNIQIIGEAVAQLPDDIKSNNNVIKTDLPAFKTALHSIYKDLVESGR